MRAPPYSLSPYKTPQLFICEIASAKSLRRCFHTVLLALKDFHKCSRAGFFSPNGKERGGHATAIQADVAKLDDIRRLFQETQSRFERLDILVANAGYSCFKPLTDITEEDFERTYTLNAKGTYFCLQEALRYMGEGGRIVCISTIGTVLNVPGGTCYFGSKAAVEQFCRTVAKEVAPRGITVNVVSPGFTETQMLLANMAPDVRRELIEMTPLHRLGQPEDIADVIAFLVSEQGRWLTRQNIAADGGIISR